MRCIPAKPQATGQTKTAPQFWSGFLAPYVCHTHTVWDHMSHAGVSLCCLSCCRLVYVLLCCPSGAIDEIYKCASINLSPNTVGQVSTEAWQLDVVLRHGSHTACTLGAGWVGAWVHAYGAWICISLPPTASASPVSHHHPCLPTPVSTQLPFTPTAVLHPAVSCR